jgi:hypothetical protein
MKNNNAEYSDEKNGDIKDKYLLSAVLLTIFDHFAIIWQQGSKISTVDAESARYAPGIANATRAGRDDS